MDSVIRLKDLGDKPGSFSLCIVPEQSISIGAGSPGLERPESLNLGKVILMRLMRLYAAAAIKASRDKISPYNYKDRVTEALLSPGLKRCKDLKPWQSWERLILPGLFKNEPGACFKAL